MRCSLRKLTTLALVVSCFTLFTVCFFYLSGFQPISVLEKYSESCETHFLNDTISDLCKGYRNGSNVGSMCASICGDGGGDLPFKGCIHHHTTVVLPAIYKGKPIVLKRKTPTSTRRGETVRYYEMQFNKATSWSKKVDVLKQCLIDLLSYKVGNGIKHLGDFHARIDTIVNMYLPFVTSHTSSSLFKVWENFEDDEFSLYTFYNDFEYFPTILGTCGTMYAVERATSLEEVVPSVGKSNVPWKQRIIVAISLLNMVSGLETAPLGPLHHCDIQISNFGVINEIDFSAIDVDMIFTDERMKEILPQPNCTSDDECDFFDCVSICDTKIKKCTAVRKTSNLQLMCNKILSSQYLGYGLIGDMLSKANPRLMQLVQECSSDAFGYLPFDNPTVQKVFNSMKSLLAKEL